MQTLPDKGKRIKDFAEKVRLAIEEHDEEERRRSLVSAARTELQSKYQQAFTMQQRTASVQASGQSDAAAAEPEEESSPSIANVQENSSLDERQRQFVSRAAAGETMETTDAGASLNSEQTKEADLAEALERVRLSETGSSFSSGSKEPVNSTARDNYFLKKQTPKQPHYLSVLEKTEKASDARKQKFKPNQ